MYRILLVDDEGLELSSLKIITQKEFGDEVMIETASSGRMAIEQFDNFRPDVVVMDIQMPGINGLDAIREIRRNHASGKFLMLTAYDNFDYVQQALQVGASGYLTKPFNRQELIGEIRGLMDHVDKEKSQRREDLILREKLDAAIPMLEAGFLYSILLRQNYDQVTAGYVNLLGIEQECGYVMVTDYEIGNDAEAPLHLASYHQKISALTKELFKSSVSMLMGKRSLTVVTCHRQTDEYAGRLQIIGRVNELQQRLSSLMGIEMQIGIGSVTSIRELSISYDQAIAALSEKTGSVAHYADLPLGKNWEEGYPSDLEYRIYDEVKNGDPQDALQTVEKFYGWMKHFHGDDLTDVKLKVLELVMRVEYIVFHTGGRTYHFMERHGYLEEINAISDADELGDWFIRHITKALEVMPMEKNEASLSTVEQARVYIEDHFAENITLNDIAEEVHISPYYFSKLFKEKTGQNFIEYLTMTRMEYAKAQLVGTDLSVKEICLDAGYSDPNYFSRSFKKYEGMTPGEYRESILGNN